MRQIINEPNKPSVHYVSKLKKCTEQDINKGTEQDINKGTEQDINKGYDNFDVTLINARLCPDMN